MKGKSMRRKKGKEQVISIVVLFSVFIFFVYLKMNPEINSVSLSSEIVDTKVLQKETVVQIEDDKSNANIEQLESAESIIQYTESEFKRAKAYLNRDWKPDHTINIAAWEYASKMVKVEDEKALKETFDMEKNQVVNAIK